MRFTSRRSALTFGLTLFAAAALLVACVDSVFAPTTSGDRVVRTAPTVTPNVRRSQEAILSGAVEYVVPQYETHQLVYTGEDRRGRPRPATAWRSSDTTVAAVSATGLVTALQQGVVTITAEGQGNAPRQQFALAVSWAKVASVDMRWEDGTAIEADTLAVGESRTLFVWLLDKYGQPTASAMPVSIVALDPAVVEVELVQETVTTGVREPLLEARPQEFVLRRGA